MNTDDEQWLTGFTEGDGTVGLYGTNDTKNLYVRVTWGQKERDVLDYIAHLLNYGNVRIKKGTGYQLAYSGTFCMLLLEIFEKHVVSKTFCTRLNDILKFRELKLATVHESSIDWLVGFWDAEGSSGNSRTLFIAQKGRQVLDVIANTFGGRVQSLQNYDMHQWYLCGDDARKLARRILVRSHKPSKVERLRRNFEGPTHYELHKNEIQAKNKTHYESHHAERLACAHEHNKKKWQEHKLVSGYIRNHPELLSKYEALSR